MEGASAAAAAAGDLDGGSVELRVSVQSLLRQLVHEQAKSTIDVEGLRRDVLTLLNFRDQVLGSLPRMPDPPSAPPWKARSSGFGCAGDSDSTMAALRAARRHLNSTTSSESSSKSVHPSSATAADPANTQCHLSAGAVSSTPPVCHLVTVSTTTASSGHHTESIIPDSDSERALLLRSGGARWHDQGLSGASGNSTSGIGTSTSGVGNSVSAAGVSSGGTTDGGLHQRWSEGDELLGLLDAIANQGRRLCDENRQLAEVLSHTEIEDNLQPSQPPSHSHAGGPASAGSDPNVTFRCRYCERPLPWRTGGAHGAGGPSRTDGAAETPSDASATAPQQEAVDATNVHVSGHHSPPVHSGLRPHAALRLPVNGDVNPALLQSAGEGLNTSAVLVGPSTPQCQGGGLAQSPLLRDGSPLIQNPLFHGDCEHQSPLFEGTPTPLGSAASPGSPFSLPVLRPRQQYMSALTEVERLMQERDLLMERLLGVELVAVRSQGQAASLQTRLQMVSAANEELRRELRHVATNRTEMEARIHHMHAQFGKPRRQGAGWTPEVSTGGVAGLGRGCSVGGVAGLGGGGLVHSSSATNLGSVRVPHDVSRLTNSVTTASGGNIVSQNLLTTPTRAGPSNHLARSTPDLRFTSRIPQPLSLRRRALQEQPRSLSRPSGSDSGQQTPITPPVRDPVRLAAQARVHHRAVQTEPQEVGTDSRDHALVGATTEERRGDQRAANAPRMPDKAKISAVLQEVEPLKLQRQLILMLVEAEMLRAQLCARDGPRRPPPLSADCAAAPPASAAPDAAGRAAPTRADAGRAAERLRAENHQLRQQLEARDRELESARARLTQLDASLSPVTPPSQSEPPARGRGSSASSGGAGGRRAEPEARRTTPAGPATGADGGSPFQSSIPVLVRSASPARPGRGRPTAAEGAAVNRGRTVMSEGLNRSGYSPSKCGSSPRHRDSAAKPAGGAALGAGPMRYGSASDLRTGPRSRTPTRANLKWTGSAQNLSSGSLTPTPRLGGSAQDLAGGDLASVRALRQLDWTLRRASSDSSAPESSEPAAAAAPRPPPVRPLDASPAAAAATDRAAPAPRPADDSGKDWRSSFSSTWLITDTAASSQPSAARPSARDQLDRRASVPLSSGAGRTPHLPSSSKIPVSQSQAIGQILTALSRQGSGRRLAEQFAAAGSTRETEAAAPAAGDTTSDRRDTAPALRGLQPSGHLCKDDFLSECARDGHGAGDTTTSAREWTVGDAYRPAATATGGAGAAGIGGAGAAGIGGASAARIGGAGAALSSCAAADTLARTAADIRTLRREMEQRLREVTLDETLQREVHTVVSDEGRVATHSSRSGYHLGLMLADRAPHESSSATGPFPPTMRSVSSVDKHTAGCIAERSGAASGQVMSPHQQAPAPSPAPAAEPAPDGSGAPASRARGGAPQTAGGGPAQQQWRRRERAPLLRTAVAADAAPTAAKDGGDARVGRYMRRLLQRISEVPDQ